MVLNFSFEQGANIMDTPTFRDSQQAFADAIAGGVLSEDRAAPTYAGHYMYMHTTGQRDLFKHQDTRQYIHNDR